MNNALMMPMLGLICVTFGVWVWMYARRLYWLQTHGIDPQSIDTPEKINKTLPESVNWSSNNLKNLFELPVLFYAICLIATQLQLVTPHLVDAAWLYVLLRALHSMVHCSINHVMSRFSLYFLSSLVLWGMLISLICQI